MTTKEMIETLRYKAENIKAHIEPYTDIKLGMTKFIE